MVVPVLSTGVILGCAADGGEGGVDARTRAEGQALFGGSASQSGGVAAEESWTIMLESVSGGNHAARAQQRRDVIIGLLGRDDVSVRVGDEGSAIVLGSYTGPGDRRVAQDLEAVHSLNQGGQRPFARAFLVPPRAPEGERPELNLANHRVDMAGRAVAYSLQVAVFPLDDRRPERSRRAAESFAAELRRAGDQAFYYHAPTTSVVTIGLFREDAYDARTRRLSPQVVSLQRRYRFVLLNGEEQSASPTELVEIPSRTR
jgi:hypothetical protein